MRFATLANGSKGNASLVEHGTELLLVDCGLSARETERRMQQLGATLADLTGILLTHEHGDHVSGLRPLVRRTNIVPHMTLGTAAALDLGDGDYTRVVAGTTVDLGDQLTVNPVTVPHDAREPVMYCFVAGGAKLALATDIGSPNDYLATMLAGCDALLLECNYDSQMLSDNQIYPETVKARIRGGHGHLGNEQAAALLSSIIHPAMHTVVAGHLSENNNTPQLALDCLGRMLRNSKHNPALHTAAQHTHSMWFEVGSSQAGVT